MDSGEAPSSPSDFYAENSPERTPDVDQHQETTVTTAPEQEQDGTMDSDSEMDISDSSRSASPEPQLLPKPLPSPSRTGVKRRLDGESHVTNGDSVDLSDYTNQRRRLTPPPAHVAAPSTTSTIFHPRGVDALPTQIWERIFVKLHPSQLGRCLRVCKSFKALLTDTKPSPISKRGGAITQILGSEAIWKQSRQTFFHQLPRPLAGFSELQMQQLLGATECRYCKKRSTSPPPATSPFDRGPGTTSVRIIWPFASVMCGPCLRDNTITVCFSLRI